MAKKVSSKGKEKKLLRKAETEKALQLKAFLSQLNEASNLLDAYPAFTKYDRNGLAATLQFYKGGELPPSVLDWAFGLTKEHMQGLYEGSPEWGWSDASKKQEMAHTDARYICVFQAPAAAGPSGAPAAAAGVADAPAAGAAAGAAAAAAGAPLGAEALQASGAHVPGQGDQGVASAGGELQPEEQPVAFMHFRYEEEEGEAVLYLYEIQVHRQAQGKGLGKFLMQLLELIARKSGVARLMLTVFHGNTAARALYRRLGYVLDDGSPTAADPASHATYDILTKWLKPRPTQAALVDERLQNC